MEEIMIEVRNLVKKYGNHTAVDDISFTIEEGCIYGFLGPNGAGKSTTMNIMTGYIGATQGEVIINGFNVLEEPKKAKQCIGYLPELPPLYLEMTVHEYLYFVAQLKEIPKKERLDAIEEVCQRIQLTDVEHRLIKNLSKGYKQRVGLASAVIGFPQIIILDEPMVGLDPMQIIEIRELIRELSKEHTIILSSHILAEVKEICDHVIIISKGKVVASDTPENLERGIQGVAVIEVEVKADTVKCEEVLKEIKGVESYTCKEQDAVVTIVIHSNGENEMICEDISVAFVKHSTPVRGLHTTKATLEDVFLELTGDLTQEAKEETDSEAQVEENEDMVEPTENNVETADMEEK